MTSAPSVADEPVPANDAPADDEVECVRRALMLLRDGNEAVAELLGSGEVDVELHPRADSYGEPAVYVDVFLPEDTPDDRLRGEALGPIHDAAFDAVYRSCELRWPYIQFGKRSEFRRHGRPGSDPDGTGGLK